MGIQNRKKEFFKNSDKGFYSREKSEAGEEHLLKMEKVREDEHHDREPVPCPCSGVQWLLV